MAKMVINKDSQTLLGEVNTSSRTTARAKIQAIIASVSEAIQKIFTKTNHKFLCHPTLPSKIIQRIVLREVDAESHDVEIFPTFRKALAFTLAETLIVMGIIGVVAALTIPNLNSSTGDREKVAKVKKIYSNLNDAIGRAQAVYGPVEEWVNGKTVEQKNLIFYERITEFMKIQKTCTPNTTGCFTKNQGNALKSGFSETDTFQSHYQVILADGISIAMFPYEDGCQEDGCYNFYVDIDGPSKGSCTWGKDIFAFVGGSKDGLIPSWASSNATLRSYCFKFGNTCSSWVIQNNNMDYIKADSSGKCPNGKVLDWTTNTSCK